MTAAAHLAALWTAAGGDLAALDQVALTGCDPAVPSSFRIGTAAQAAIAAAGLAAAEIWRARGGGRQRLGVDIRHAAMAFASERHLRIAGRDPPATWDAIAGVYPTGDGRMVRLHTNFAHHRDAVLGVLGCAPDRAAVGAALAGWTAAAFEAAAIEAGGVVAMLRSQAEWDSHPQSAAVAGLPLIEITRIGPADPRPLPPIDPSAAAAPLAGLRVLDLSRVIAGPVAGRSLAAHGAEVMLISAPHLPLIEWLMIDTGRGKRSAHLDLRSEAGRAALVGLLRTADIFSQGYRPQALAGLGLAPEDLARLRPGIVVASLSAYGRRGPWAGRRGFDSLVQAATGFNLAEAAAAGTPPPRELPVQAIDHATGYLMACGAMLARARQAREGGSWHVQVSLARTGHWLRGLGRVEHGFGVARPAAADHPDWFETFDSPFGQVTAVRHPADLSDTPARWARGPVPPGHDAPRWPGA